MKSHISYMQLPLQVFVKTYPYTVQYLPAGLDLSDENYYVRFSLSGSGTPVMVELGYLSDNWKIH